jgi:hypothetical protein
MQFVPCRSPDQQVPVLLGHPSSRRMSDDPGEVHPAAAMLDPDIESKSTLPNLTSMSSIAALISCPQFRGVELQRAVGITFRSEWIYLGDRAAGEWRCVVRLADGTEVIGEEIAIEMGEIR